MHPARTKDLSLILEEPPGCIKVPLGESPVVLVSVPVRSDTLMSALSFHCLIRWSRLDGVVGRDKPRLHFVDRYVVERLHQNG